MSLPIAAEPPAAGPENLLRASGRVYSGGEPAGDADFARLAELGVKTVVSVDGKKPDVAAARRHGLRYVHIPIGYGGVGEDAALALARLMREGEMPVFIHCHHGKHRGPAAAAVACIAAGDMGPAEATEYLKRAGTSPEYPGLWRDVARYRVPPADAALPPLREVAEVGSLAAAMADIDRAFDDLKLCRDAGWVSPPDHPDVTPAREALLLAEGFRESARNLPAGRPPELAEALRAAESVSRRVESALRGGDREAAAAGLRGLDQSCKSCHARHRQ